MAEGKRKYLEDAARVIDGRVADLRAEMSSAAPGIVSTSDWAAALEAEHCARLIRALAKAPYRGDPYKVAHERWARGKVNR